MHWWERTSETSAKDSGESGEGKAVRAGIFGVEIQDEIGEGAVGGECWTREKIWILFFRGFPKLNTQNNRFCMLLFFLSKRSV